MARTPGPVLFDKEAYLSRTAHSKKTELIRRHNQADAPAAPPDQSRPPHQNAAIANHPQPIGFTVLGIPCYWYRCQWLELLSFLITNNAR